MKVSNVLTEKEKTFLSSVLLLEDLDKEYTDDEWFNLVDLVQDEAVSLLQRETGNAVYMDNIAAKISAYEF